MGGFLNYFQIVNFMKEITARLISIAPVGLVGLVSLAGGVGSMAISYDSENLAYKIAGAAASLGLWTFGGLCFYGAKRFLEGDKD